MKQCRILTVAFDGGVFDPQPDAFGAEAGAEVLERLWDRLGVDRKRRMSVVGAQATRAVLDVNLRRFKKQLKAEDRAILVWLGPTEQKNDHIFLRCRDSMRDELSATAIAVEDLFAQIRSWKAKEIILIFATPGLPLSAIESGLSEAPHVSGILACGEDEVPLVSAECPEGIWLRLFAETLERPGRAARERNGTVTVRSLTNALCAELPRRIRRELNEDLSQTPQWFGRAEAVIRDAAPDDLQQEVILNPDRLRRIVLRSESYGSVQELADFRKSYTVPDKPGAASRRFVQRLATRDLQAELDRVAVFCREHLGYRKKDLACVVGPDGSASLSAPDFEFFLTVELDESDSSRVIWRRELGRLRDLDLLPKFDSAEFGLSFDQLVFELVRPIDLDAFMERWDEAPIDGVQARWGAQPEQCELVIQGLAGSIEMRSQRVIVRGQQKGTNRLFDLLIQFLKRFTMADHQPLLLT